MTTTSIINGIVYTIVGDHAVVGIPGSFSSGYDPGSTISEDLSFELKVNGYPVTEIETRAFLRYNKPLRSITLHNGIKKIGSSAFDYTLQQVSVTLSNSLEYIVLSEKDNYNIIGKVIGTNTGLIF